MMGLGQAILTIALGSEPVIPSQHDVGDERFMCLPGFGHTAHQNTGTTSTVCKSITGEEKSYE